MLSLPLISAKSIEHTGSWLVSWNSKLFLEKRLKALLYLKAIVLQPGEPGLPVYKNNTQIVTPPSFPSQFGLDLGHNHVANAPRLHLKHNKSPDNQNTITTILPFGLLFHLSYSFAFLCSLATAWTIHSLLCPVLSVLHLCISKTTLWINIFGLLIIMSRNTYSFLVSHATQLVAMGILSSWTLNLIFHTEGQANRKSDAPGLSIAAFFYDKWSKPDLEPKPITKPRRDDC